MLEAAIGAAAGASQKRRPPGPPGDDSAAASLKKQHVLPPADDAAVAAAARDSAAPAGASLNRQHVAPPGDDSAAAATMAARDAAAPTATVNLNRPPTGPAASSPLEALQDASSRAGVEPPGMRMSTELITHKHHQLRLRSKWCQGHALLYTSSVYDACVEGIRQRCRILAV